MDFSQQPAQTTPPAGEVAPAATASAAPAVDPNAAVTQQTAPAAAPTTTPAPAPAATPAPAPGLGLDLGLEDVLGINADQATIYEGGVWPKGVYVWAIEDIETDTYEVKNENHPRNGKEVPYLTFKMKCIANQPATMKDSDNRSITKEEADKYIGKVFNHSVMFGNEGLFKVEQGVYRLPNEGEVGEYTGTNQLHTFMSKVLGDEAYQALKIQTGGNTGAMLQQMLGKQFACSLDIQEYEGRKNTRVALFEPFSQVTG